MQTNSDISVETLYDNHTELVKLCNQKRLALPSAPTQSGFRVYCLLLVQLNGKDLLIIEGTNGEQGYIGGAICAERAALMRLRHYVSPEIKKVIVTTDSSNAIAPGLLCREYLMSTADPSTVVVMGNCDSSIIRETTLDILVPYPYLYRFWHRENVLENAHLFSQNLNMPVKLHVNSDIVAVFQEAMTSNQYDKLDSLHPVRLSAAVMLTDGSIKSAWLLKGLEYGCTVDPVTQLIRDIENHRSKLNMVDRDKGEAVKYMIMVDQFGVCHAPFAQARAILNEHGFGGIKCIVHDALGNLDIVEVRKLVPFASIEDTLSHTDFK